MYWIPQHIRLERRRLALAGVLAFASGCALYAHVDMTAMGVPFPVFVGIYYAVAVVLAAAVSSYQFPRLRKLIDGVSVSRLGFAFWVVAANGQEISASPLASAIIVVGSAMIMMQLLVWFDTFSRIPAAPARVVILATRGRAAFDWLDNAKERNTLQLQAIRGPRARIA